MNAIVALTSHPGAVLHMSQAALVLAAVAAAWALHAWRLRVQERDLMLLVEQRTGEWRREAAAHAELRRLVDPAGPAPAWRSRQARVSDAERQAEDEPGAARVLAVAPADTRTLIVSGLAGLEVGVAAADSTWSARVACRDAFDAGRPYNLVLLDASLADGQEPGQPERLQEDLQAFGTRVAVVRARGDESIQCDENPDRRGRTGFTAPAGADAAALGLRSRCGD